MARNEASCECGHGFSVHRVGLRDGVRCTVPGCKCLLWFMTNPKLPDEDCDCVGSHSLKCRYYKGQNPYGVK
jgi:hypothetical protein